MTSVRVSMHRSTSSLSRLFFVYADYLLFNFTETLKKQSAQQAAEYDRLAEQYNKETGKISNKRVD